MDDAHEAVKAVLLAMGIDEVESMDIHEMRQLAMTLELDLPELPADAALSTPPTMGASTTNVPAMVPRGDPHVNLSGLSSMAAESSSDLNTGFDAEVSTLSQLLSSSATMAETGDAAVETVEQAAEEAGAASCSSSSAADPRFDSISFYSDMNDEDGGATTRAGVDDSGEEAASTVARAAATALAALAAEDDNSGSDDDGDKEEEVGAGGQSAEDESSHDAIISSFCDITGSDPESARHLLEAFGWNLEGAIPMYLENNTASGSNNNNYNTGLGGGSSSSSSNVPAPPARSTGAGGEGALPPPLPPAAAAALGGEDHPGARLFQHMMMTGTETGAAEGGSEADAAARAMMSQMQRDMQRFLSGNGGHIGGGDDDDDDEDDDDDDMLRGVRRWASGTGVGMGNSSSNSSSTGSRVDQYDADGIRMPDPVQRQRLVGGSGLGGFPMMMPGIHPRPSGGGGGGSGMSRYQGYGSENFGPSSAEDPSIEWLFPPAIHLSLPGSLDEARSTALQSEPRRWLVVNLQSHEQFASHMLNRDTWAHETVDSVLRSTFVFWQRGHTSGQGRAYMQMHKLSEEDLPHIGIIDPRTGAKKLTLTGFIAPEELALKLVEFADRNSLEIVSRSRNSSDPNLCASASEGGGEVSSTSDVDLNGKPSAGDGEGRSTVRGRDDGGACGSNSSSSAGIAMRNDSPEASSSSSSSTAVGADATRGEASSSEGFNYGPVPLEPPEGEADVIKVSVKLSNGKSYARRYRRGDLVRTLFAVTASEDAAITITSAVADSNNNSSGGGGGSDVYSAVAFDLVTRFPQRSLLTCLDQTMQEAELAGSQVILKLL
mmetsp:Transcript_702/g.1211  ORF Transcript_702/g.1211 Transcript_702/m.1211 type:complete len:830 (-) Transcript_702:2695-5184(-)